MLKKFNKIKRLSFLQKSMRKEMKCLFAHFFEKYIVALPRFRVIVARTNVTWTRTMVFNAFRASSPVEVGF